MVNISKSNCEAMGSSSSERLLIIEEWIQFCCMNSNCRSKLAFKHINIRPRASLLEAPSSTETSERSPSGKYSAGAGGP